MLARIGVLRALNRNVDRVTLRGLRTGRIEKRPQVGCGRLRPPD
jgi:hypothetical protein